MAEREFDLADEQIGDMSEEDITGIEDEGDEFDDDDEEDVDDEDEVEEE
jgi:hypothetical protein